jgi:hypothetical protein
MLVKCICTNCAGHLEFEEENVGEVIQCPHCGFETTLFLPGTEAVDPETIREARRRKLRRRALWLGGAVLALVVLAIACKRWALPAVQDLLPAGFGTFAAVLALLLGCWVLVGLVFWVLFPVFIFLEGRRISATLAQIEMNLRPVRAAEIQSGEDEGAEPAEDSEPGEEESETNLTGRE